MDVVQLTLPQLMDVVQLTLPQLMDVVQLTLPPADGCSTADTSPS